MLLGKRVALVTGPAKGMGADTTLALAREGADLALLGRDVAAIAPVAERARSLGRQVTIHQADVTDADAVDAAVVAALAAHGRIEILVNIAGGTGPLGKTFFETSPAEFDNILRTNITGCWTTMRAVAPGMIAQRYGRIVNVGGTFGLVSTRKVPPLWRHQGLKLKS